MGRTQISQFAQRELARPAGLEPAAPGLEGPLSRMEGDDQLSTTVIRHRHRFAV